MGILKVAMEAGCSYVVSRDQSTIYAFGCMVVQFTAATSLRFVGVGHLSRYFAADGFTRRVESVLPLIGCEIEMMTYMIMLEGKLVDG